MRRLLLVCACVLAACESSNPPPTVAGDGTTSAWTRGATGFTSVKNRTALRVEVREANDFAVTTLLDSNLQSLLWVEVRDGVLDLHFTSELGVAPSPWSLVAITMPDFRSAVVEGTGSLRVEGITGAKDLTLAVAGQGPIVFSGTAHSLTTDVSGSGDVTLSGSAQLLAATARAKGSIDALRFTATSATLSSTAQGNITALVDGGPLSAQVLSEGNIDWWGRASPVSLQDHGAGTVRAHGDLP